MKTASLDLLEKSELPPAQARAILQVMESELATKADLAALQVATKADMQAMQLAIRADVQAMQLVNKADMQALRAELIGEIKGTIRWNFAFWVAQLGAMAAILKLLR